MVYGELGHFPLEVQAKRRMLNVWFKLVGVNYKFKSCTDNTRVRTLGCLGCIGAFARRNQQHAGGPFKKCVVYYLHLKLGSR